MKCFFHPDLNAVASCACGRHMCQDCVGTQSDIICGICRQMHIKQHQENTIQSFKSNVISFLLFFLIFLLFVYLSDTPAGLFVVIIGFIFMSIRLKIPFKFYFVNITPWTFALAYISWLFKVIGSPFVVGSKIIKHFFNFPKTRLMYKWWYITFFLTLISYPVVFIVLTILYEK